MLVTRQDSTDDSLTQRLLGLLGDRKNLKEQVQNCFDKVVAKANDGTNFGIGIEGLSSLCEEVEYEFGLPVAAFGKLQDTHVRFDFDGNGTLDFKEAYRCVKRAIADYVKTHGVNPRPKLRCMTPDKAGFAKVRVLGSGGQGEAVLVKNAKSEELVLKTYPREVEQAGALMEMMDEAGHMSLLDDCDHIAKVLDVFEDETNFYMVTPVNRGGDWTTLQRRAFHANVTMTEEWYRGIFEQAFKGLSHLHRNAVMHCDIKEPNLMIKSDDYAKPSVVIIDLGLSQAFFPHDSQLVGTPGYVPPETWATCKWFPRGDVFSLGVVCLQLLTDRIPGTGTSGIFTQGCNSVDDVMKATRRRQPLYRDAKPQSPELLCWLEQCLEKERKKRPTAPKVLEMPWFSSPCPSQKDPPAHDDAARFKAGGDRRSSWLPCCGAREA